MTAFKSNDRVANKLTYYFLLSLPIAYCREVRLPRLSQKAANRWQVAVTLLRNPSLIKYRKQGGITHATSVSLRSIRVDTSDLI